MIRDTSGQDQPSSRSRLSRRPLIWAAPAVGLALLCTFWVMPGWSFGRSIPVESLRIAEVTRGNLTREVVSEGTVISANSPILYAIAPGTVKLAVVAGDFVKEGEILATIDSPELHSRLLQEESTLAGLEAEADRSRLEVEILTLEAQMAHDQASIDHTAAMRDVERYQRAYNGGAVSKNDLDRAKDRLEKAVIGLQNARASLELQSSALKLNARNKQLLADRQRSVVEEARRQVDGLSLRAPFAGQIGRLYALPGNKLAADAPVLTVVDLNNLEVEARIPESYAREIALGMSAQLTSGSGGPYNGEVSAVSPEVVGGEVITRIRFTDDQPAGLRQNQRVSARILIEENSDVIKVERGPFVERYQGAEAWVLRNGTAQRVPIRLGTSSAGEVEIIEGLNVGDQVIIAGSEAFGDGEKVTIAM